MPTHEFPEDFDDSRRSSSASSNSSSISSDVVLINNNNINNNYIISTSNNSSNSVSLSLNSINSPANENFNQTTENVQVRNERNKRNDGEKMTLTYQPIKLPSEPTLEEMLKQVTGNADLSEVRQIKLRVISSVISLQRLPYFLTGLRCLNLEGSLLFSLRDLGCDMSSLIYLNVSRCGLKTLDGTNGLSTLFELIADGNSIEDAGPCSNLHSIKKISLRNNKIKEFSGMMFLGLCHNLKYLDISNNPINRKPRYRDVVKENIPQLVFLDNCPYGDISDQLISDILASEYKFTENESEILANQRNRSIELRNEENFQPRIILSRNATTVHNVLDENRPSTADRRVTARMSDRPQRPQTADGHKVKHDVTIGEPVVGSILTKARKLRKLKTAWGDSTSCSSISSSDSSYGGVNKTIKEVESEEQEDDTEELLKESQQWRQRSQDNRERFG